MRSSLKLKKPLIGSYVGIIAPASTMSDLAPEYIEIGLQRLKSIGLKAKIGKYAFERNGNLPVSPSKRIADFENMLEDSEVSIIMAVYGGYNSIDLLEEFPYQLFSEQRKPFIGYSDITALLVTINKFTGIPTLHGPGFASFCEPNLHNYTLQTFRDVIWKEKNIVVSDPMVAADNIWYTGENIERNYISSSWQVYRHGLISATLIGGNADTLLALSGTDFIPDFSGKILFIEFNISTDFALIDRKFAQLHYMKVFDQINGLIVGKRQRSDEHIILEIINKHCSKTSFPIIYSVNCSHIDPLMTLPIGEEITLDTTIPEIRFTSVTSEL